MPRKRTKSAETQNSSKKNSLDESEPQKSDLKSLTPERAIEMYLADRSQDLRQSSLQTHRSALNFFERWLNTQEIENLNELTGRQLHHYRIWRREDAPTKTDVLAKATEQTQQRVVRQFIRYCGQVDAVPCNLYTKVRVPTVRDGEDARSNTVDADQAQAVIRWLSDYKYASLEHVTWLILADTGARIGTIRALDIDDYCPSEEPPHARVRHRPETGTELKNGSNGERLIGLSKHVCAVVDDYLDEQRPDVVDEHGRVPLLATSRGRISTGTIRSYIYRWSRPCEIGEGCPHGRDIESCDATESNQESKCPSSESPHAIRRGYISHQLSSGVDRSYLSGRCDVSEDVLRTHYDARDEHGKMEVRRRELDHARRDHRSYGGR
jgi:site-specific recombinase XerD